MMQKLKILELPSPSTACICEPTLSEDVGDLLLSMDFDYECPAQSACLRFVKARAFRYRAEIYCTVWHIADIYDTVCEALESDWVQELRADSVPEWRDRWVMRHFMIYVDSYGCLEVVAESVALDDCSKNPDGL